MMIGSIFSFFLSGEIFQDIQIFDREIPRG